MKRAILSLACICLSCSLLVGQKKLSGDNYLTSSQFYSTTFNGITFKQLKDAIGKESVLAELSKGQFSARRSDTKAHDWITYSLFDSISRISVGYTVNIMGVDISLGDPISKLGNINTAKTTSGKEHFASFVIRFENGGISECPIFIPFDPKSKKIKRIVFFVPT